MTSPGTWNLSWEVIRICWLSLRAMSFPSLVNLAYLEVHKTITLTSGSTHKTTTCTDAYSSHAQMTTVRPYGSARAIRGQGATLDSFSYAQMSLHGLKQEKQVVSQTWKEMVVAKESQKSLPTVVWPQDTKRPGTCSGCFWNKDAKTLLLIIIRIFKMSHSNQNFAPSKSKW